MSEQAQGAGAPAFTPGPYDVIPTDYPNENDIVSYATDPGIAVAQHVSDKDAHLIAAAPELYEALYRLVRDCEIAGLQEQAGFDCWIHMANKALAKARGAA